MLSFPYIYFMSAKKTLIEFSHQLDSVQGAIPFHQRGRGRGDIFLSFKTLSLLIWSIKIYTTAKLNYGLLQGGSDFFGTLSIFTVALNNNLFYYFFPQNRLSAETNIKTNSRIPTKMNQQEGAGAGILSGLCARRTMIESKSLWKHQKEHCCGGVGGGGLASQLPDCHSFRYFVWDEF
jgi:hypothetical protein